MKHNFLEQCYVFDHLIPMLRVCSFYYFCLFGVWFAMTAHFRK